MENKLHYVVATCIIVKDGRYLITKRNENEKAFPGKWTVPGGKLEVSEYIDKKPDTKEGHWYNVVENLIKREVKEEVNLDIEDPEYCSSISFIRPDNLPVIILSFYAKYKAGQIKLEPSLTDHAWVSLEEVKDYDLIAGIREEIEMADKALNGIKDRWRGKY